jgi:hypothetical protein
MSFIDPKLSESAIDDNERAVIGKYDFEVRDKGGHFEVTDPVVRKANRGKGGKHSGGNLSICLSAAVSERQAHEKAVAAAPPVAAKAAKKAAVKAVEPPAPVAESEASPEPENNVVYLDSSGAPVADHVVNSDPEPEDALPPEELPEVVVEDLVPGNEIEVDEENIDNTGKRAKKSKKEEKGPRKDNRYLRAAKVIVNQLDIDVESLAIAADMSEPTAGHCLEAWKGVTAALIAKGWLKIPGQK